MVDIDKQENNEDMQDEGLSIAKLTHSIESDLNTLINNAGLLSDSDVEPLLEKVLELRLAVNPRWVQDWFIGRRERPLKRNPF